MHRQSRCHDPREESLVKEIQTAARVWLESVAKGSVAWCSVGVIGSDTNVHWHTDPEFVYWKNNPKVRRPTRDDVEGLAEYTIESRASLANLSKAIFQAPQDNPGLRGVPYLYRMRGGRRIGDEFGAAVAEDFKEIADVKSALDEKPRREWARVLKNCIPPDCTTMLVPFVHWDGSDPRYVCALVVCADLDSPVWPRIPELKALLLPLAEPLRHAPEYGILPEEFNTNELLLLRVLLLGHGDELFREKLHEFDWVKGNSARTKMLVNKFKPAAKFFKGFCGCMPGQFPTCCEPIFEFCKSLFYVPQRDFYKGTISRPAARDKAGRAMEYSARFLESIGGVPVRRSQSKSRSCGFLHWPTTPGILGAIALVRLAKTLEAQEATLHSGESGFEFVLTTKRSEFELRQLERSVWRMGWRGDSGGNVSDCVATAMTADFSAEIGRFRMGRVILENYEQLLRPAPSPVMFPAFSGRELTLRWGGGGRLLVGEGARTSVGLSQGNGEVKGLEQTLGEACSSVGAALTPFIDHRDIWRFDIIIAHDSTLLKANPRELLKRSLSGRRQIFCFGSANGTLAFKPFLASEDFPNIAAFPAPRALGKLSSFELKRILELAIGLREDWPANAAALARRVNGWGH